MLPLCLQEQPVRSPESSKFVPRTRATRQPSAVDRLPGEIWFWIGKEGDYQTFKTPDHRGVPAGRHATLQATGRGHMTHPK